MYKQVLRYISNYVEYDLKQLQCDPAVLLSARPVDDPFGEYHVHDQCGCSLYSV